MDTVHTFHLPVNGMWGHLMKSRTSCHSLRGEHPWKEPVLKNQKEEALMTKTIVYMWGFPFLKGCFIAESQRCGRWRRKRGEDASQHLKFGVSNHAVALLRGQLPHPVTSTEAGAWVCVELRALGKLRKK